MTTRIHYKSILSAVEAFAKQALKTQVLDPSDQDYGGFRCPELFVCEPIAAANVLDSLVVLYFTADSQYHESPMLLERIHFALQFLVSCQHEDGTIDDYSSGHIRAASNTALACQPLFRAHRWLSRKQEEHEEILKQTEIFLGRGITALRTKPLFASHHRWVAASALLEYDKIFVDRAAVQRAEEYLHDNVDINNNGVYRDQTPIYSMLSNDMLLNLAEKLNRPILLESVRRSLNFLLYTFHASGEVATEYSHHKAIETGMPSGYGVWKRMSIIDHNGYYAAAGDLTLTTYLNRVNSGLLRPYLNHPNPSFRKEGSSRFFMTSNIGELLAIESELNNDWISRLPVPREHVRVYGQSNIGRIRCGKMSATILGGTVNFFTLHNGAAIIDGLRIKYVYHGFTDYEPTRLEADGNVYTLRNEISQWVGGPAPKRREVIQLNLQVILRIMQVTNGFEFHFATRGEERIPMQIEFGLRKQGTLRVGDMAYDLSQTDLVMFGKESATISNGDDEIQIDGGETKHKIYSLDDNWTMNTETARLLLTPRTPYTGVIRITCR